MSIRFSVPKAASVSMSINPPRVPAKSKSIVATVPEVLLSSTTIMKSVLIEAALLMSKAVALTAVAPRAMLIASPVAACAPTLMSTSSLVKTPELVISRAFPVVAIDSRLSEFPAAVTAELSMWIPSVNPLPAEVIRIPSDTASPAASELSSVII